MTDPDSVEERKAEAAAQAGDNHGVGVNADEPSVADQDAEAGAEPVTTGEQTREQAVQEPPD